MDFYEKAYKEALERAKAGKPMDEVFPELKESEDERIRKFLIGLLSSGTWKKEWPFQPNECVAYLEKQKDEAQRQFNLGIQAGREEAMYEMEEQKPAEWKPLPESMEALLLAIEGKWDAIKPTGYMSRRLEDLYDGLVNTFDVDEKYLCNLPKTEYTEKDIEEIKALKEKIDSSMETRPAEWSEEDKKYLNLAINIVASDLGEGSPTVSWLKSLRPQPHWKPLPESMEALMYAIEGKWDMIKPTSYLSRRLEDLYDGLVNTYNIDENSEYIYPEDKK